MKDVDRDLFAAAAALPPADRADFVRRAVEGDSERAARILSLLEALEEDAVHRSAAAASADHHIESYQLLERIGEGSFGEVWMAEQSAPVQRRVAVKVLKPGLDSREVIQRFERERRLLASLDHPNVAKVLDGGTTSSGRPWFAMELVKGIPVTRYAELRGLDIAARIPLFEQICMAVQHAHQKGVVHRDLKPSNILVTEYDGRATCKVIDFGIAKCLLGSPLGEATQTLTPLLLGTPSYMAPEQAIGGEYDIDTRADIYSLGAVLYELLTGTPPRDGGALLAQGLEHLLKALREQEPVRPSEVRGSRVPPGELDWIVMKALDRDRDRRYPTAGALAEDLARLLRHEPVLAGPPSNIYRLRKYLHRHRKAVCAVGAVVAALLVGLVLSLLALDRAVAAEADAATNALQAAERAAAAESQARRNASLVALWRDALRGTDPRRGKEPGYTMRNFLAEADERLAASSLDPLAEIDLRNLLSVAWNRLGEHEIAIVHQRRALQLADEHAPDDTLRRCKMRNDLGAALSAIRAFDEAEPLLREALELARRVQQQDPEALTATLINRANHLALHGRGEEARSLAEEAVQLLQRTGESTHLALLGLGRAAMARGERKDAERWLALAEADAAKFHGAESLQVSDVAWVRAENAALDEHWAEAIESGERVLAITQRALGASWRQAEVALILGQWMYQHRDREGALEHAAIAADHIDEFKSPSERVLRRLDLGMLYLKLGAHRESIPHLEIAANKLKGLHGPRMVAAGEARRALSSAKIAIGDLQGAEADLRALVEEWGQDTATGALAHTEWAECLLRLNRPKDAEAAARIAVKQVPIHASGYTWNLLTAEYYLAASLRLQSRYEEAAAVLRESLPRCEAFAKSDPEPLQRALEELLFILEQSKAPEAERDALRKRIEALAPERP